MRHPINIALELAPFESQEVIVTGGTLRARSYELVGHIAERTIRSYHLDIALIGVDGLDLHHGISTFTDAEAHAAALYIEHAQEVWVVADHSKIGKTAPALIAPHSLAQGGPSRYRRCMDSPSLAPTIQDIRQAAVRILPYAHHTPVFTSRTIDAMTGASIFFKCENLQRVGAFKFRGAANAVFSLDEAAAARGVATHSSGNHAQALALAARLRGIEACIVMPRDAPRVKVEAVRGYGARIVFSGNAPQDRERTLQDVVRETGAEFVHPSDDLRVIAGQGTCALEILQDTSDLDMIVTPVGGGGLLSGTAIAARAFSPRTRVIGAEPAVADDAQRSFRTGTLHPSGNPRTVADGLRTSLGPNTFRIVRACVADIVTAGEDAIVQATRFTWERLKTVIEPSAAVPLAAILEGALDVRGMRVAIVLSGGNVDLDNLPWAGRTHA